MPEYFHENWSHFYDAVAKKNAFLRVQVGRNALKKEHEMLWKSYWTEKSKGLDLFFFQACFSSVTGNMSRPL